MDETAPIVLVMLRKMLLAGCVDHIFHQSMAGQRDAPANSSI
jgi:hypothetical protein